MAKNVIVLGMARSGTSLTASIFGNNGYFVGEAGEMARADHMNPKGYWESTSFLEANEMILKASGFARDNTWIYQSITDAEVAFIDGYALPDKAKLVLSKFSERQPWVWKDPRLCYTLGCWWPHIDPDSTVVILVRRDSDAIFNSFVRVGWRKNTAEAKRETCKRIEAHIANAERLIERHSIKAVTIDYKDFKKNPGKVVDDINRAAGLQLTLADIGYEEKYDHNNLTGKLGALIDRVVSALPLKWIKTIKRLVPVRILKLLYPERYD